MIFTHFAEISGVSALAIVAAGLGGAVLVWVLIRGQVGVLKERLSFRDAENARLAADQEKRAAQFQAEVDRARSTLQAQFEAAAAKLLDEKSAKFTQQNRTQIEEVLHPLRQQLTDFRQRVDTVYKTESDDRASLKAQVEQLRQLNSRITDEARALTQALKGQAQARGAWGELVLERILESAGLRRGEEYMVQESMTATDGRRIRPDVIVKLPEDRHLVIDSKVSLIDYEQCVNAAEPAGRETARKAHGAAVRRHIDSLSRQQYETTEKLNSPEYVLMFVPIEPAFLMAIEVDPKLYEWAFDKKVIIVTAPTLLVTLKTIASIWKQDRQTKNVLEIARRGGLLYDKFATLFTELEEVGRHLGRAQESYEGVVAKLRTGKGNLIGQVEELKTLGAKAQKSLPAAETDPVSTLNT